MAMTSGGEPAQIEKRMVVEYGITLDGVWLPLAMLRRLGTHGPWDNPFTEASADQESVLLAFLDAIPYEPTVPIDKVTGP
jgi:hypothetical protein